MIVTRDRKLVKRLGSEACCFVSHQHTEGQFNELVSQCNLTFHRSAFLSRCAVCNANDFVPVSKDEARDAGVKEKVLEVVQEFWQCAGCKKVYWEGPKFDTACQKFLGLVSDDPEAACQEFDWH